MPLSGNCKRKINWFQLSHSSGNFAVCMVFLMYVGKVCSQVHTERPRLSPIPSGGLEILLMAKLTISDEKRRYLAHLKFEDTYRKELSSSWKRRRHS